MPKTICEGHAANLETLYRAFASGDVVLVEGRRKGDGAVVALLCAIAFDGTEYQITPFAEMVNGNPFELYDAPDPDGAFKG